MVNQGEVQCHMSFLIGLVATKFADETLHRQHWQWWSQQGYWMNLAAAASQEKGWVERYQAFSIFPICQFPHFVSSCRRKLFFSKQKQNQKHWKIAAAASTRRQRYSGFSSLTFCSGIVKWRPKQDRKDVYQCLLIHPPHPFIMWCSCLPARGL